MVTVAFITPDLTHLRYFIPLAQRLPGGTDVTFYLFRGNQKYNGLHDDGRYGLCVEVIKRELPSAVVTTDASGSFDVVFQVEVSGALMCKRRYSIQHGFDYVAWPERLNSEVDGYIISPFEENRRYLHMLGVKKLCVPPAPVCMWNSGWHRSCPHRMVTVLYPDRGQSDMASRVIDAIYDAGCVAIVKQRRKHQPIVSERGVHVYDDVWYPSEAIEHPLMSLFTAGFGSSAFVDLAVVGLNYVNIDVNPDGGHKPAPRQFVHPRRENYVRITDEAGVMPAIEHALSSFQRVTPTIDEEQLRSFILGLLDVCDSDGQGS